MRVTLAYLIAIIAGVASTASVIAAEPARPNILLAIADDVSWPHMSAYGCKFVKTPNFDQVAREGVLFNNAFTPLPKCSPSRAALLTGRNPWQLEEASCHNGIFSAKFPVYPALLEAAGYHVGFTGKGWGPGDWKKGGFKRNPVGPEYNRLRNKPPPTPRISNIDYAANFEAFLKAREPGKPFCFWYGGLEPHRPYEYGTGLKAGKRLADVEVPPYLPDTEVVRNDLLDYALEIEWFDTHLGRMLKKLKDLGELDNTLIVVTADNGMPFPRVKGHIFEDACHEPMAIRWGKSAPGGRVVDDFVSFIDLAPTFCEAAGVKPPEGTTGRSLVDLLRLSKGGQFDSKRDHVLLGRERTDVGRPNDAGYPVRAIRTSYYFYARNFAPERWPAGDPETGYRDIDDSPTKTLVIKLKEQGDSKYFDMGLAKRPEEELYDLRKDPHCIHNLAGNPDRAGIKARLREVMEKELREQQDPRLLGKGAIFDTYRYLGNRSNAWDVMIEGKKP